MMTNSPFDAKDQRIRFVEAARHLGVDEDETAFKAKLAVIARQRPKDEPPSPSNDR